MNTTPTKERKVKLTEKFSEWYLDLPDLPGERKIQDAHVLQLAEEMEADKFLGRDVIIKTIAVKGKTFKGNGGHTCSARAMVDGKGHDYLVSHHHYTAKSMAEACSLYRRFDPKVSARTYLQLINQHISAMGLSHYGQKPYHLAALALAHEAGGWSEKGSRRIRWESKITLPTKKANKPFLTFLSGLFEEFTASKHLQKGPVACAILMTFRKNVRDAEKFWTMVRDGEGLTRRDPGKLLRDFLMTTSQAWSRGANAVRRASFHEICSKCVNAWNAYRDRRTLDALRYYRNGSLPKAR